MQLPAYDNMEGNDLPLLTNSPFGDYTEAELRTWIEELQMLAIHRGEGIYCLRMGNNSSDKAIAMQMELITEQKELIEAQREVIQQLQRPQPLCLN